MTKRSGRESLAHGCLLKRRVDGVESYMQRALTNTDTWFCERRAGRKCGVEHPGEPSLEYALCFVQGWLPGVLLHECCFVNSHPIPLLAIAETLVSACLYCLSASLTLWLSGLVLLSITSWLLFVFKHGLSTWLS